MRGSIRTQHPARRLTVVLGVVLLVTVAACGASGSSVSERDVAAVSSGSTTVAVGDVPGVPITFAAPSPTVAVLWPALTLEGWVEQVDLVVVGTVVDVGAPAWNSVTGERPPSSSEVSAEQFQIVTIEVDRVPKKRDVPLTEEVFKGVVIEVMHSITNEGDVFPKDLIGRRTVATVGVRDFIFEGGKKEKLLTVGMMSSYVEIDGAAVLFADAFADTGLANKLVLSSDDRALLDAGRATLRITTVDDLIERADNTKVPLEQQLGYGELFDARIPDREGLESP